MKHALTASLAFAVLSIAPAAAQTSTPSFIRTHADIIAITHVTVIDGAGAAPRADQTVLIDHGRIAAIGRHVRIPAHAEQIEGRGKTLIPGMVGMHEHLFAPAPIAGPLIGQEQFITAPLLYLASGVTTARTTGSMDPYGDLGIKREIDAGRAVGPDLDLTTPYLDGSPPSIPQLYPLRDAEDARETIRFWHARGFTSVKAYANITPDELHAAIDEAHRLGMKITGHLCSVGYEQAIAFGIDNLEHGPFVSPDGDLDPQRVNGTCQSPTGVGQGAISRDIVPNVAWDDPQLTHLIQVMVAHHVPLTSTLSVIEGGSRLDLNRNPRLRTLLAPAAWENINRAREAERARDGLIQMRLQKEMQFERAFAAAGGILMVGCDPTGDAHTIAGLGDQRNVELLVQAGFTIPQVIRFATLNGAAFEGRASEIGSIEIGKRADLVLLNGDLIHDVNVIERPEIVFKNGVGYDSEAIYASISGQVGLH
ncbi:MAG: amidohydrolase family protein [Proteobacteria bacterium]|nr:amidohydrolase family protein [Pseudomonadota bacterium]